MVAKFPVSLLIALLLAASWAYGADEAKLRADMVQAHAKDSDVILRGTVTRRGTSTVLADDVSRMAVVRVHELVAGPPALKPFVGRDITVLLREPRNTHEGEVRVFFSTAWKIGEDVAVIELGSYVTSTAIAQELASDVQNIRVLDADEKLKARLDKAEAVVAGRVSAVRPGKRGKGLSEHDPEWAEADIEVEEVLKGSAGRTVTILFPASQDVMWYRVPKPKVDTRGVWILDSGLTGAPSPKQIGLASPEGFLPLTERPRVKRLIK